MVGARAHGIDPCLGGMDCGERLWGRVPLPSRIVFCLHRNLLRALSRTSPCRGAPAGLRGTMLTRAEWATFDSLGALFAPVRAFSSRTPFPRNGLSVVSGRSLESLASVSALLPTSLGPPCLPCCHWVCVLRDRESQPQIQIADAMTLDLSATSFCWAYFGP